MSARDKTIWRDYVVHGVYFNLYAWFKYLPSPIGDLLRYWVTRPFMRSVGKVRIYEGVTVWYPYRVSIGHDTTLNEHVYISGYGDLTIGNGVRIGHRTSILTSDHVIDDASVRIKDSGLVAKPVRIDDDVFIGCNCTILGGVHVGRGAVIAAGSVVNRDVPDFAIVGGVPARVLKYRRGGQPTS